MRKLNMTPEKYQEVQQEEYLEAKAKPDECGLNMADVVNELEQYQLMEAILMQAQNARAIISDIEGGLVDLDSIPIPALRTNHVERSNMRDIVDELFSKLAETYQDSIKTTYRSFSTDTLNLMKALEARLNRLEPGE